MPVLVLCPSCGTRLRASDHSVGKRVQCPQCGALAPVPEGAADAEAVTARPEPAPEPVAARPVMLGEDRDYEDRIRTDGGDGLSALIPYRNGKALLAYYLGIFGLIPCAGLLLGPAAAVLGILGLRRAREEPSVRGAGHSIAGIILGTLAILGNYGAAVFVVVVTWLASAAGPNPAPAPASSPPAAANPPPAGPFRPLRLAHSRPVLSLAFSPDGKRLATGDEDRTVRLWNLSTGVELYSTARAGRGVRSLSFSPDGKHLAAATEADSVHLLDGTGRGPATSWSGVGPVQRVTCVAFAPDGQRLATGTSEAGEGARPGDVWLWRVKDGSHLGRLRAAHTSGVRALAFSQDGRWLATAGGDGLVKVWDAANLEQKFVLRGHERAVNSVAFSPDGKVLLSGGWDETVRLWDVPAGKEMGVRRGHTGEVFSVAFAADGKTFASGGDDAILRLWTLDRKEPVATLGPAPGAPEIYALAFSPDGHTLAYTQGLAALVLNVDRLRAGPK